jgi:hypothetical protein
LSLFPIPIIDEKLDRVVLLWEGVNVDEKYFSISVLSSKFILNELIDTGLKLNYDSELFFQLSPKVAS